MNKDIVAEVDTPHGKTEAFVIDEAVRQGTIYGTTLCGVSTSRINKMGQPDPLILYRKIKIEYPIFVDDIASMGGRKQIENAGTKMNGLEKTKKFEFNNKKDKTEQMIMRFSKKEVPEQACIEVRKGKIGVTDKYKYLGDNYDQKGTNEIKILKKMEKAKYMANSVKRMGSYESVGAADMSVRLMLLEEIVKLTLLDNMETWCDITTKEERMITKHHHEILCIVLGQKRTTPYYGMIGETGIWPYVDIITYKKMMYLHHLIHSDDERTARQIIITQEANNIENSWYSELASKAKELNININTSIVEKLEKSAWKEEIKEKTERKLEEELKQQYQLKTKLRFLRDKPFQREDYLNEATAKQCQQIMELRLNMLDVKNNYKGQYEDEICVGCFEEPETTEHFLTCPKLLKLSGNQIEMNQTNINSTKWLIDTCKKTEKMMEIRKRRLQYDSSVYCKESCRLESINEHEQ